MLLLVEGIDKSGKSTFIKEFSLEYSIPIYRKSLLSSVDLKNHHSYFKGIGVALLELHNIFKFDLIVDRSFISDYIYSNRDELNYKLDIYGEWELLNHSLPIVIINFNISKETFIKRLGSSPDPYMNFQEYEKYGSQYDKYLQKTKYTFLTISGEESFNNQIQSLVLQAKTKNCHEILSILNK